MIYGKNGSLMVTDEKLTLCDRLGEVLEEFSYEYNEEQLAIQLLDNFAQSVLSPEGIQFYCKAVDSLPTMALIEAAYLSARTAMPEEPEKVLERGHSMSVGIWPQ
jgi:hypothetical protein